MPEAFGGIHYFSHSQDSGAARLRLSPSGKALLPACNNTPPCRFLPLRSASRLKPCPSEGVAVADALISTPQVARPAWFFHTGAARAGTPPGYPAGRCAGWGPDDAGSGAWGRPIANQTTVQLQGKKAANCWFIFAADRKPKRAAGPELAYPVGTQPTSLSNSPISAATCCAETALTLPLRTTSRHLISVESQWWSDVDSFSPRERGNLLRFDANQVAATQRLGSTSSSSCSVGRVMCGMVGLAQAIGNLRRAAWPHGCST